MKGVCARDGCERPAETRQFCATHYEAWRASPDGRVAIAAPRRSAAERFWARVTQSAGPDACWPWMGHRDAHGYGQVGYDGKVALTHRLALQLASGRDLAGLDACHSCDNPPCCNPAHLFEGSRAVNNADKVAKGRNVVPTGSANGSVRHPESRPRGEANVRSKLTDALVRELRANADLGPTELAKRHGVAASTVGDVLMRRTWKHVA